MKYSLIFSTFLTMRPQICFSTFLFLSGCLLSGVSSRFDPTTYTRTTAACKAVRRDADHAIVDIELSGSSPLPRPYGT